MNSAQFIFYGFGILMILSALFLAISKNIVHSAFSFLAFLLGVAVVFIYAGAEFLAVTQLLIYIGGVLVLLIFGVMLTAGYSGQQEKSNLSARLITGIACCLVFACFVAAIQKIDFQQVISAQSANPQTGGDQYTRSQKIGFLLMTDYVLPFEASGILLMVSLMGAAMIAGRKTNTIHK